MSHPDFWRALGLAIVATGEEDAVVEMTSPDWAISPFGTVHGGAISMLCDTALAVAIARRLDGPEDRIATHQLTVSYTAFTTERLLRCHARLVSLTRTVAVAEGDVHDGTGRLVAKALGTFGVRRRSA
jgi:acyl-CoA thioesterase